MASGQRKFLLVAIDYFTKWVEAESYAKLGAKHVAKFIRKNLFCRYGIPHHIVSNNVIQFQGKVRALLRSYKVEHHKSLPYRPQANGAVEAANKNIKKILSKMTQTYRDWSDRLPYALWGYRTTVRTSTRATPSSLVYDSEAVLPVEVELESIRIAMEFELTEAQWAQQRHDNLTTLDSQRLKALYHT